MKHKDTLLIIVCCALITSVEAQQQQFYEQGAPWFQDITQAALDIGSASTIAFLQSKGGWGGGRFQIDFSIEVLTADQTTPFRTFTPTGDFYTPDCDLVPLPVPTVGNVEGETGYQCVHDGDCHLLVFYTPTRVLYEMWRANIANATFDGGCLAVWQLNTAWNADGRGNDCTSADAAGLQISPLLFTADEVASGQINHAIRFILPNDRIEHSTYVHPGTHATTAASGGATAPPYGARLRLRSDFPITSLPNQGARVVAAALQKYGMFLADGGTVALTARSDNYTTSKWSGLLGALDLNTIKVTDFQMVNGGTRYTWVGDCNHVLGTKVPEKRSSSEMQLRLSVDHSGRIIVKGSSNTIDRILIMDLSGRTLLVIPGNAIGSTAVTLHSGAFLYQAISRNNNIKGILLIYNRR
jgi:serine/threonine-protein kinase